MAKKWRPPWVYPATYYTSTGKKVSARALTRAGQIRRLTRKIRAAES